MDRMFRVGVDRHFLNANDEIAYGDIGLGPLDRAPNIAYQFLAERTPELTPAQARSSDGLILGGLYVDRNTFVDGAEDLIVIARFGVGYDTIDVSACTENDVALCTTPRAAKHPVASASLTFMLSLAKRMPDKDRLVRTGRWFLAAQYSGQEIFGRTLGIVGLGNTGIELARLVGPFDMRILAFDPYASPENARRLGIEMVSLDDVFRQADFVCIHAKLTEETRGLIGQSQISLMKPTAYFINVARGPIVDQRALTAALKERRIAGAGLDVFETEPLSIDDPLIELDNVMLAPHTAAHTHDLGIAMGNVNSEQMIAASRGEPPPDIINREVLDRPGFQAKLRRWRGIA